jgi:protein-tyrosine phosphatase
MPASQKPASQESSLIRRALTFFFAIQDFLDLLSDSSSVVQDAATALRMVVTNGTASSELIESSVADVRGAVLKCELSEDFEDFLQKRKSSASKVKSKFELCHRVIPDLFVGGWTALRDDCSALQSLKVTHVLGLGTFSPRKLPDFIAKYTVVNVEDNNEANIKKHFPRIVDFISGCFQSGGICYVHCGAGISRAPTACAAYLIHTLRMTVKDSILLLKRARPGVRPNANFVRQLEAWEEATCKGGGNAKGTEATFKAGGVADLTSPNTIGKLKSVSAPAPAPAATAAAAADKTDEERSATEVGTTTDPGSCSTNSTKKAGRTRSRTSAPSSLRSHITQQRQRQERATTNQLVLSRKESKRKSKNEQGASAVGGGTMAIQVVLSKQ